jgi:polysaccharide export outer membrane protein
MGGLARFLAIAIAFIGLCAGCAPPAPNVANPEVFPGGVPLTEEHTLAPGDEIEVRFPFYADLNDRVLIGPDGRLSLQFINTVALGGLTVEQATALLNERYAKVIKSPQATITVRTYAPQTVYVDGWVNSPGVIRSDVPLTVSRALAQAGGTKSGARTDGILLLRRAADGRIYYYQIALGNFAGAGAGAQDPMLKSYDVVYVPQTALASLQDFLASYLKNIPFYINYTIQ